MKNIFIIIILLLSGLAFNACENALDVEPQSIITAQSMWETEGDARSGVAGMMNSFRSSFNGRDFLFWFELRSGFWQFGEAGGGAGTPGWQTLFINDLNASVSPGTDWSQVYQTINMANLVIKYLPDIEFINSNQKDDYLAQAYFVRAYSYFALARIYGDVPLLINGFESFDDPSLFPTKSSVSEVFLQIKNDLDQSESLFTDDNTFERIKPSLAATKMLKADVYLWTGKIMGGGSGDLNIADAAIDDVLGNSNYQLLPNYENVFRSNQNDEVIFSLFFDIGEVANQYANQFIYLVTAVPGQYQNNPVIVGSTTQWLTYNDDYINTYLNAEPLDTRALVNNMDYSDNGFTFRWVNKFQGEVVDGTRYNTSFTPLYRYAEAILFKAEIQNALGNTPEALDYLNDVAERAYGISDYYSGLTQTEADDAILHERIIEFGAEGKSWFDFIRFDKAFDDIPSLVGREGANNGNILLFPLSPETITRNPKITQTSGY